MGNSHSRHARVQRKTLLLVGEGHAEQHFLNHIKALYLTRHAGRTVLVKNAKGKGGKGVLDWALSQRKAADYDQIAVLLDTDTDWDDTHRRRAREAKIIVIECTPCLEALLLQLLGYEAPPETAPCKQRFLRLLGEEAHSADLYPQHFTRQILDLARSRVSELEQLMKLFGV